jgi:hypothetical protein
MNYNYASAKIMSSLKGIFVFKVIVRLVLVLVILNLVKSAKAQLPALIGSTTVSASGAGVSGKPTNITWNIPSGKNRMMIISMYFERHHDGTGNNYPSTPSWNSSIPLKVGGITFNVLSGYHSYYVASGATDPTIANFSADLLVYRFRDAAGLPTGPTSFDFSAIKDPLYAGDDAIINIAVFENVAQTGPPLLASGYQAGLLSATNLLTQTASAYTPVPIGRSSNEILYLANSGLTQNKNIIVSSGWTNVQNVIKTNSAGTSFSPGASAPINEPDGVASQMAYRFLSSGNPSITYDRSATPPNVYTHSIIGLMHALLPLAKPSITGTVYSDMDGPTNINGVVTNAGGLYVNAIDASGNLMYSATVDGSGVFTIPTGVLLEGDSYRLELSKNTGTIGAKAPFKALPTGWSTVGENVDGTSPYVNDGANDGTIIYTLAATNVAGLRYGIKFIDNDNDGIPDATDLDDDNDGILDANENYNCLTNVATPTNPNPTASVTNSGLTIQYTESGANVGTYTDASVGFAGLEPFQGSTITYQFSLPVNNLKLWFADLDNREYLKINYYDENNNRITDLTPYITANVGDSKGLTANASYGLMIDPSRNFTDVSANQYVELTTPFLIKKVEVTFNAVRADGTPYISASQTPEVYIKGLCFQGDTDGDGTTDNLDLDSDNDGCVDALEGGASITASQLVTAVGTVVVGTGSSASNLNLGNTVGNTATTMGVPTVAVTGQAVGTSANANLKDAVCFSLALTADNYSGTAGTAFTTANILTNDLLDASVPVIGASIGQVVIAQSGVWPTGITLNTATGGVNIANTVNGGVYIVNYQVCVNGASPALCQTQTITITVCGKFPLTGTPDSYTKTGISDIAGFAGGWPGNVPNGFIAVESRNKGFVITRVKNVTDIPNAELVEGMLVYDISAACVKLYNGSTWKCLAKDCN